MRNDDGASIILGVILAVLFSVLGISDNNVDVGITYKAEQLCSENGGLIGIELHQGWLLPGTEGNSYMISCKDGTTFHAVRITKKDKQS